MRDTTGTKEDTLGADRRRGGHTGGGVGTRRTDWYCKRSRGPEAGVAAYVSLLEEGEGPNIKMNQYNRKKFVSKILHYTSLRREK